MDLEYDQTNAYQNKHVLLRIQAMSGDCCVLILNLGDMASRGRASTARNTNKEENVVRT